MVNNQKIVALQKWNSVVLYPTFISLFIITLYYYWFAIADRYGIFLYNHLNSNPFDASTRSRYWMAGLVASGGIMILYTLANWYLGRFAGLFYRTYIPPKWWQVWLLSVPFVGLGILTIIMNVNHPTLPFTIALPCASTVVIGLALALLPGEIAARQPSKLIWLIFAGLGLVPSLLLLRMVELPSQGLAKTSVAYTVAFGTVTAGAIWSWIATRLYSMRSKHHIKMTELFMASICLSYLLLPVVHHLFLVPPEFRYISNSANFFALSFRMQLMSWLVAVVLTFGITKIQRGQHEQARTF